MSEVFQYIDTYPGSLREFWKLVSRVYGLYRSKQTPAGGELLELDPPPSQYYARTRKPETDIKIVFDTPDETREAWRHERPERISTTVFGGKRKRPERRGRSWIREMATGDATRRPEEQLVGVWQGCRVSVRLPSGELKRDTSAWIAALPRSTRETMVAFRDGCRSRDDTDASPIGQMFHEFVREVAGFWLTDPLSDWLSPKKEMPPAADPLEILEDMEEMRKHYRDYNLQTAKDVVKAIPRAWDQYSLEYGRWGPGCVARYCNCASTTVGRYLKAFWLAGIHYIDGIPIPYTPRSPR